MMTSARKGPVDQPSEVHEECAQLGELARVGWCEQGLILQVLLKKEVYT